MSNHLHVEVDGIEYPRNVADGIRRVFVGDDGIAICAGCVYEDALRKGGWLTRWWLSAVAEARGYDEVTGTGEGHCSNCDRDVD